MRRTNPLGRIPSLILDGGEVLIDSAAILDHIDEWVGPERALIPRAGKARRAVLRQVALACGIIDKAGGGVVYERLVRPSRYRWPEWIARCRIQAEDALGALDAEDWPEGRIGQAEITAGCMLYYLKINAPDVLQPGRHAVLDALLARCEALAEFQATSFTEYAVPRAE